MSTLLKETIYKVEEKWLKHTYGYIQDLFKNKNLPSHDHLHHLRVWSFACELLYSYSKKENSYYSYKFVESLFFACFFHDSGLTQSIHEEHGKLGIKIFNEFIKDKEVIKSEYYDELIEAIEMHDDKTYMNKLSGKSNYLYKFLTVSDDLDAFGALGLMRYFEIYTYRKVKYNVISEKIKNNICSRYLYVSEFLKFNNQILIKHKNRYKLSLYYLNKLTISNVKWIVDSIIEGDFIHGRRIRQQAKIVTNLINHAITEELNKIVL